MDHKSQTYEEQRLRRTVDFAAAQSEQTAAELEALEARIGDMLVRYNPDNFELFSEMVVAEDRRDGLRDKLGRCRRARSSPYFGRVDFTGADGEENEYYIGRGGLYDEQARRPVVIDWRTPVANLYYEGELGPAGYRTDERTYDGTLTLKRTYSIAQGRLDAFYDSDLVTNDELLQAYLAKNADTVLRDIVATIQKDQNEIIRIDPWYDVVVQGVAGSGKTTVAMHRLAFLIFNFAQRMKADQYAVIGTNRMFLSYVSGMLPDLGVESVTQMVMPELFESYLGYEPAATPLERKSAPARSSLAFFEDLRAWLDRLTRELLYADVTLGGELLLSAEEIEERFLGGLDKPLLTRAKRLSEYIDGLLERERPRLERVLEERCEGTLAALKTAGQPDRAAIAAAIDEKHASLAALDAQCRALRGAHAKKARALREERVYAAFLSARGLRAGKRRDVYDLASLAYIAHRLRPMRTPLRHIVVDEAQDFGPAVYCVLTAIYPEAGFTILGDVLQNIGDGVGVTDWDEVLQSAFAARKTRFCVLAKSYRNTVEIAEAAARVTQDAGVRSYKVIPVVRHGPPVAYDRFPSLAALERAAAEEARGWKGGSLALICPTAAAARRLAALLPQAGLITIDDEQAHYDGGVTVFDADSVKGLEFDRVLVCGAGARDYPAAPRTARLLYVVLTRALHELRVMQLSGAGGLLEG